MVFTTERLFEVAIASWPEWDLNPRPKLMLVVFNLCSYLFVFHDVINYIHFISLK